MKRIFCIFLILALLIGCTAENRNLYYTDVQKLDTEITENFHVVSFDNNQVLYYRLNDTTMRFYVSPVDDFGQEKFIGEIENYVISTNPLTVSKINDSIYFVIGTGSYEDFFLELFEANCKKKKLINRGKENVARYLAYVDNLDNRVYTLKGSIWNNEYSSYVDLYDVNTRKTKTIIEKKNVDEVANAIYSIACDNEKLYLATLDNGKWILEIFDPEGHPLNTISLENVQSLFWEGSMPLLYIFNDYLLCTDWTFATLSKIDDEKIIPLMFYDAYLGFFPIQTNQEINNDDILFYSMGKYIYRFNQADKMLTSYLCPFLVDNEESRLEKVFQDGDNLLFKIYTGVDKNVEWYITSFDVLSAYAEEPHSLQEGMISLHRETNP